MEYKLNQLVKITRPWSGSCFKEGEYAVIKEMFSTGLDSPVLYGIESIDGNYFSNLYSSEFDSISYGDCVRLLTDEELAELFFTYTQFMSKKDLSLSIEDWIGIFKKPCVKGM